MPFQRRLVEFHQVGTCDDVMPDKLGFIIANVAHVFSVWVTPAQDGQWTLYCTPSQRL